jgi:hypothetical protein
MTLRQKHKFFPELSFDTIQTLLILLLYFSQWHWLTYVEICFLIHFYTHYIFSRCNIVFQSGIEAILSNTCCSIFDIMPMFLTPLRNLADQWYWDWHTNPFSLSLCSLLCISNWFIWSFGTGKLRFRDQSLLFRLLVFPSFTYLNLVYSAFSLMYLR